MNRTFVSLAILLAFVCVLSGCDIDEHDFPGDHSVTILGTPCASYVLYDPEDPDTVAYEKTDACSVEQTIVGADYNALVWISGIENGTLVLRAERMDIEQILFRPSTVTPPVNAADTWGPGEKQIVADGANDTAWFILVEDSMEEGDVTTYTYDIPFDPPEAPILVQAQIRIP